MARRVNYNFDKRQRELKKQEKARKKRERRQGKPETDGDVEAGEVARTAESEPLPVDGDGYVDLDALQEDEPTESDELSEPKED